MQVTAEDSGTLHALYLSLYRKSAGLMWGVLIDCTLTVAGHQSVDRGAELSDEPHPARSAHRAWHRL